MELGQKLKQARLEAGLSQRQLCGEQITRNMLSQIESGTARPSMTTLTYLAGRLGKSVSYFLEEAVVSSANQGIMESARRLYDQGDYPGAVLVLEAYREPDPVYDREKGILLVSALLGQARQALAQNRRPYARELLMKASIPTAYCTGELARQRLLLLGQSGGEDAVQQLPSLDAELLLRASQALRAGNRNRARRLLEAAEDWEAPLWQLLRGEVFFLEGTYREAARCFLAAEESYPRQTAQRLESCFRELEDYKRAYYYACKNREK